MHAHVADHRWTRQPVHCGRAPATGKRRARAELWQLWQLGSSTANTTGKTTARRPSQRLSTPTTEATQAGCKSARVLVGARPHQRSSAVCGLGSSSRRQRSSAEAIARHRPRCGAAGSLDLVCGVVWRASNCAFGRSGPPIVVQSPLGLGGSLDDPACVFAGAVWWRRRRA